MRLVSLALSTLMIGGLCACSSTDGPDGRSALAPTFSLDNYRRSNDTNMAHLSYEKIEEYSGIERPRIRRAISLLAAIGLVHVEHLPSRTNDRGTANAYRLALLDPYVHLGTRGRDPAFGVEETTG